MTWAGHEVEKANEKTVHMEPGKLFEKNSGFFLDNEPMGYVERRGS